MGARPLATTDDAGLDKFQSTRPHGGATTIARLSATAYWISIHAPAWGRDCQHIAVGSRLQISIHAPAWGRDTHPMPRGHRTHDFNPRARMGARLHDSFHLPHLAHFNPRARMGARLSIGSVFLPMLAFQSTRPHGGATAGMHTKQGPD